MFIDKVEINNRIEKLNMYVRNEFLNTNNLKNILTHNSSDYISKNVEKILEIGYELSDKLTLISNIHRNYIKEINNNLEDYKKTARNVSNIFNNIK